MTGIEIAKGFNGFQYCRSFQEYNMLGCGIHPFSRQVRREARGSEVQFVNETEAQKLIEHNESLLHHRYSNIVAPIYFINYSSGCILSAFFSYTLCTSGAMFVYIHQYFVLKSVATESQKCLSKLNKKSILLHRKFPSHDFKVLEQKISAIDDNIRLISCMQS